MNPQFYVEMNQAQKDELFHYINEQCALLILPALIIDQQRKINIEVYQDQCKYLFVCENDVSKFQYRKAEGTLAQFVKVIYPFDNKTNILPHIEFTQERNGDRIIGRFWIPINDIKKESAFFVNNKFMQIKKWITANCKTIQNIDGIRLYAFV